MTRRSRKHSDIGFTAISVVGGLISPDKIAQIAATSPDAKTAESYFCPKGTNLRDEIARYFRIGQAEWQSFSRIENPGFEQCTAFTKSLLEEVFGFKDLKGLRTHTSDGHSYNITLEGKNGRIPIVVAPPSADDDQDAFKVAFSQFGDAGGGRTKRRPDALLQEWLNASEPALWGLVFAGDRLRLLRDNASFTRPAYIEADLGAIFRDEMFADFTALWLLIHGTRFGNEGALITDCALERWREEGVESGTAARDRLRENVEEALLSLGQGFLEGNPDLREKLDSGTLSDQRWFQQLLRIVYRLIFTAVTEERDLLHEPTAKPSTRTLYAEGYSFAHMRERATRRTLRDPHGDVWEGARILFRALDKGQTRLGLPALGGVFDESLTPDLNEAKIANKHFLNAIYRLSFIQDEKTRVRINWRDMATEELGSVYEGLLELVPTRTNQGRDFAFAGSDQSRGNARKSSGSYYTPDSLVQALLDSALDPVLDNAESNGGEEAILNLSVIDPACGSAHFLLGAARRMADRVATLRDSENPDFQHALRDVVRRCIYGVDRNPMAVELAKVALWIEAVEPGKPLGFLDANIRCGDSLLGVFDLEVLRQGIPDTAYKELTGDEKTIAREYNRQNKAEREGQGSFDFAGGSGSLPPTPPIGAMAQQLRAMPEDTPRQIATKAKALAEFDVDKDRQNWSTGCDLYIAAFLIPKDKANYEQGLVPTTGSLWSALSGKGLKEDLVNCAEAICANARAFHWPLEFPDIMQRGGFDIVLGNPPWERVKLQEQEFFSLKDSEIATAKNAAARKKLIAQLDDTNPPLAKEWQDALRTSATESHFMRESGRFPRGGVGDVNTYAVFTDLAWQVVHPSGRVGLIIPNGLVVGFTYREFLRQLLSEKSLVSFYGFENEDKIFKDVHNETKFGLLTIGGTDVRIDQPWFTAHIRQPKEIVDPEKRYALTVDEIRAINPNTLNLPAFRWAKDAKVTTAIHTVAPILVEKQENTILRNDWKVSFKCMFHMANDSGHFIDHENVAPLIKKRPGTLAVLTDGREAYPLYEGKMFWHFDHRYGTYEKQTEKQANKGGLPRVTDEQHSDPHYQIQPRYWIDKSLTENALAEESTHRWFFTWRDLGPSERSLVGTIIPKTAAGHKAPLMICDHRPADRIILASVLSSLTVDYAVRQKTNAMTFFIMEQAPVINRSSLNRELEWLSETASDWLLPRAFELYYTNHELSALGEDIGRNHPPFVWNAERRSLVQAEIDAAILHLHGLDRKQADWVIDSFTVLRKYEERDHGEFRTKRLVLTAYDAMAKAKEAGSVYRTSLQPPPADPSLCHPASSTEAAE